MHTIFDAFCLYHSLKIRLYLWRIYDFIKFLHFVLKISATTISCITALSVQFIRHRLFIRHLLFICGGKRVDNSVVLYTVYIVLKHRKPKFHGNIRLIVSQVYVKLCKMLYICSIYNIHVVQKYRLPLVLKRSYS